MGPGRTQKSFRLQLVVFPFSLLCMMMSWTCCTVCGPHFNGSKIYDLRDAVCLIFCRLVGIQGVGHAIRIDIQGAICLCRPWLENHCAAQAAWNLLILIHACELCVYRIVTAYLTKKTLKSEKFINPSAWEAEAGGSLGVWDQPGLQELVPGQAPRLQRSLVSKRTTTTTKRLT